MRTRFLPKMTHDEVCEYVKRSDIIFVPFGTVEVHGTFPLDVEQTLPEAFSLLMAEKVDGLVLGQLPYFFCGASPMSPGTIQMPISEGLSYLKAIAHSLLNQGFRRQIYVSSHGPAFLTGGVLVTDFFDEAKCPISYIDMINVIDFVKTKGVEIGLEDFDGLCYGAYEILGRKNEIVVDPELPTPQKSQPRAVIDNTDVFQRFAHGSGSVGFYFEEPQDHAGMTGACKTPEERDQRCAQGAAKLREIADNMEIELYVQKLRELDQEHQSKIIPRYAHILPKNKFSPNK